MQGNLPSSRHVSLSQKQAGGAGGWWKVVVAEVQLLHLMNVFQLTPPLLPLYNETTVHAPLLYIHINVTVTQIRATFGACPPRSRTTQERARTIRIPGEEQEKRPLNGPYELPPTFGFPGIHAGRKGWIFQLRPIYFHPHPRRRGWTLFTSSSYIIWKVFVPKKVSQTLLQFQKTFLATILLLFLDT